MSSVFTPYPAIDLKEGRCVRLLRGDMANVTVYADDPAAQARQFQDAGFPWLHLVDLDGALQGVPVNGAAVEAILRAVSIPVQLGGGIRDLTTLERWLELGIARVILGTVAVKHPALVREACSLFPGKVAVGIDARGGKVATDGWAKGSDTNVLDLARAFEDAGVAALVYTDIDRDGALQGVNVDATLELARAVSIPVIASGGVTTVDDLHALKRHAAEGVAGAIIGRALYDGRLTPAQVIAACA